MANPWDQDETVSPKDYQKQQGDATAGTQPWQQDETVSEGGNPLWEGVKKAAMAADDLARLAANGITAGGADNLAAYMSGQGLGPGPDTLAGQHAQTAAATERAGVPGQIASVAGEIAPSLLLPGGMTSTLARATATGGALGTAETIGKSYFNDGTMPTAQEIIPGAILGAVGGAAGYGIGKIFQRPAMDAAREKSTDILTRNGIDVYSGQATGNRAQMLREAGASGAQEAFQNQKIAFSRAALRKAGITADAGTLDDGVLEGAFDTVGKTMNKLAASNNMTGNAARPIFGDMLADLHPIVNTYTQSVGSRAPIVRNTLKQMATYARKGTMTGQQYQQITSELEGAARVNPALSGTVRQMRGIIDRGMEKYISQANPSDLGFWQMARQQYKNLMVIENAVGRTGNSEIAGGLITPKALQQATKSINGLRQFTRNKDAFSELANAGVHIMKYASIPANASADEIAKLLARRAALGVMTGVGGMTSGMSPGLSTAAGVAGVLAPSIIHGASSLNALAPVGSLMGNSALVGGALGGGIGAAAAPSLNPFVKAQLGLEDQ